MRELLRVVIVFESGHATLRRCGAFGELHRREQCGAEGSTGWDWGEDEFELGWARSQPRD